MTTAQHNSVYPTAESSVKAITHLRHPADGTSAIVRLRVVGSNQLHACLAGNYCVDSTVGQCRLSDERALAECAAQTRYQRQVRKLLARGFVPCRAPAVSCG